MKRDNFTLGLDLGRELIIDNFAGGGGTSTGLEMAFGRPVDIAINHNPEALAMHALNHPHTQHLCESVWEVDPIAVTKNQPVGLVWLSPDCKHFSKAKGGKPREKSIRDLAWVVVLWAQRVKPALSSTRYSCRLVIPAPAARSSTAEYCRGARIIRRTAPDTFAGIESSASFSRPSNNSPSA